MNLNSRIKKLEKFLNIGDKEDKLLKYTQPGSFLYALAPNAETRDWEEFRNKYKNKSSLIDPMLDLLTEMAEQEDEQ